MQNIIKNIRRYYPVSDQSIQELAAHFTVLELPRKHLFIEGCRSTILNNR